MGIDLSKLLEEQETYTTGIKPKMKVKLNIIESICCGKFPYWCCLT